MLTGRWQFVVLFAVVASQMLLTGGEQQKSVPTAVVACTLALSGVLVRAATTNAATLHSPRTPLHALPRTHVVQHFRALSALTASTL
jgi:hypothetical protein